MAKHELAELKPAPLWNYFYEICQVPRPSKKEEKILAYILDFCEKHSLAYQQDKAGNIVISKAATAGLEDRKTIILQGHVDMVCEKNSDVTFDFDKDPIQPYVDGDWVKARGTTLGADNGIAVATMLMLLASKDIPHAPLQCLLTTDEETGLNGASALDGSMLKGDVLLNLDTEDEGVFTIGCAGGLDTVLTIAPKYAPLSGLESFAISIKGLHGGHSGVDIHKGNANAVKLLSGLLARLSKDLSFNIVSISGGNLRNAIAREAQAVIALSSGSKDSLLKIVKEYETSAKKTYEKTDEALSLTCAANTPAATQGLEPEFQKSFIAALELCPHGVLKMNKEIPTLVDSSTNLASIKNIDGKLVITTSQRSPESAEVEASSKKVIEAFRSLDAKVLTENKYPGWTPNFHSPTLEVFKKTYVKLFSKEPVIEVIHAGLECGVLSEKKAGMDLFSFGPTIKFPHSPSEKVQISSVEKYMDLLLEVIKA